MLLSHMVKYLKFNLHSLFTAIERPCRVFLKQSKT